MRSKYLHLSIVVIVFFAIAQRLGPVFPDGDLDPLRGETLAQTRALDDAGELLGRKDLEDVRKGGGENGRRARVEAGALLIADVDKVHLQSTKENSGVSKGIAIEGFLGLAGFYGPSPGNSVQENAGRAMERTGSCPPSARTDLAR